MRRRAEKFLMGTPHAVSFSHTSLPSPLPVLSLPSPPAPSSPFCAPNATFQRQLRPAAAPVYLLFRYSVPGSEG